MLLPLGVFPRTILYIPDAIFAERESAVLSFLDLETTLTSVSPYQFERLIPINFGSSFPCLYSVITQVVLDF